MCDECVCVSEKEKDNIIIFSPPSPNSLEETRPDDVVLTVPNVQLSVDGARFDCIIRENSLNIALSFGIKYATMLVA